MSHFSVLVLGEDVEGQLAPFDENKETPRYVKYTKAELIEKTRKEIEDYKNGLYAKYIADPVKYSEGMAEDNGHLVYVRDEFPKKLEFTDEELYQEGLRWYEPEDIGAEGEVYSEYNPQSKWDWYEVGGRWAGKLVIKPEFQHLYEKPNFSWGWDEDSKQKALKDYRTDSAQKGHIDWERMFDREMYEDALKIWEIKVEGRTPVDSAERKLVEWEYTKEYFTSYYKDIVDFATDRASFRTYAVLNENGWFEAGQMGWFGCSNSTPDSERDYRDGWYDRFIAPLSDDTLITIVDCHI